MTWQTPPSLMRFCREILPLLYRQIDGKRMLETVASIVETDRWNSFDRFHDTTQTLVRHYEEAGAAVEVTPLQTGGRIGSGRWIIHEAADVHVATVDVVHPVQERVLDYQNNPWHIIQWSGATPREGMKNEMVILDSREELERIPSGGLSGKIVLTRMDPRSHLQRLADTEAVGVITDRPVKGLPEATAWTKFGWGGVPLEHAALHLVGLVLSADEGERLRKMAQKHGKLTLHTKVDIRKYVGTHDVVSGIIRGAIDSQDELWVLAHSSEPGALDNASGVALCIEIARVLESLIAKGLLERPRRSIRLLHAYECYGFFKYLKDVKRLQTPLAGVVVDTVGSKPEVCNGRLEWHATIPMSAGFVDRVGEKIIQEAIALDNPGYQLFVEPFMSTSDTLIGDSRHGFPAPWLTTHHRDKNVASDAYHSSGDTLELVSPDGLATCTAAMAGYLYFLANADSKDVVELATAETDWTLDQLKLSVVEANYAREGHRETIKRLKRWLWGGTRVEIMNHLDECERQVHEVVTSTEDALKDDVPGASRIPHRTAVLSPDWGNNTHADVKAKMDAAKLKPWALFWADGNRHMDEIADLLSSEYGKEVTIEQVITFFEAHAELDYTTLIAPKDAISKSQLITDFKTLGLEPGMDVMVHSSLSEIGYVIGGADAVVDALLAVIGESGTLMMPSFNHRSVPIFNPMTTPTTNGAIPDAMWRRSNAVRSLQPTHAVAAIGPKAEEYCRDHLEAGIWAQDSPIGKLIHGGGYILALGVTHESSTAYHVAEMSIPCGCIDSFGNVDRVVMPDGRIQEVQGLAFRSETCPVSPRKLDETLDECQLQRHGKVGNADAVLVKALNLWEVRREHLKDICPTCTIKPRITK